MVLYGTIDGKPALLLPERAPFPVTEAHLSSLSASLSQIKNLGANDIYYWFLASSHGASSPGDGQPADLKINLIYPCTRKHLKKYSSQGLRVVTETPAIYLEYVRPYMQKQRDEGRLNWVFNILEGRAEQEDVLYREHGEEGFLLAPDLNWDRKTLTSLHLLGIAERRDIWSMRDLTKNHIMWLKHMKQKLLDSTAKLYPSVNADQLKLYVHCTYALQDYHECADTNSDQPTYYHFHIHIVHVQLEAGGTQAVGKAFGLENMINQLDLMADGKSMEDVSLTYHVGESSDLWSDIFQPLQDNDKTNEMPE